MKKITLLIIMLVGLFSFGLSAQDYRVSGKIVDKQTREGIPGVNILIVGTATGTVTDLDGNFTLKLSSSEVKVQVSFIGYTPQTLQMISGQNYEIALEQELKTLGDVVVVGYGTQKKANLTGAVASVDVKALEARPIPDVGRGLQGTTPGLTITIPSGEIGSDPIMKIRGQFASMQGGSAPLILMDNVEIPSIQMLNPDDIESISVLKDAASSSIYGAKAAFGVVLITTKKGAKKESVNITYSANLSFQNISKKMEMAGIDALEYSVSAFERVGGTVAGAFWQITREGFEKAKVWQQKYGSTVGANDPMVYGRDWYVDANNRKIGLRTYDPYNYMVKEWTPTQTHNLSVNGKSGKTDYNISLGYLDQEGLIKPSKHDDFRRYNGSIRVGTEISDKIKVFGGAMFSKRIKRYAYATNSTTADPWLYIYRWGPTFPFTTEDGEPIRNSAYEMAAANTASQETNYTSLNGGIVYTPMKDWKINFDYTYANQEYINKRPGTRFTARDSWVAAIKKYDANGNRIYVNDAGQVVDATSPDAMAAFQLANSTYTSIGSNPDHNYRYSKNDNWNTINLNTTYDLKLADNNFKFMLGLNSVAYEYAYNWSQTTQLVDYSNPQFDLAYGTMTTSGGEYWESQLGFFGRINYNFKEKYLLEANLRYDGTSKFPTDLQWRWFPSFSAGWRVNEEDWMQWAKPTLSALKMRASWGTIGDQTVSNSLYIPTMAGSYNTWIISNAKLFQFSTPGVVTPDVTWQDITTLDLGFDARFLDDNLGVSFDWFERKTENMIVPMEGIPATLGTSAPKSNYGSLKTNGFEIQVDYNHRFSNGLGINVVATFDDAITEITKYGSSQSIDDWYVGKKYGEIWGYETDRLYQKSDFEYDAAGKLQRVTSKDGFQVNKLSDANGVTQGKLQSGNFYFGPGDVKFKDLNGDGVINYGSKLLDDLGDLKVIGNSTPRYNYSLRVGADYKGFDASIFLQGVGKREVWGNGFLAIPGYNSSDGAMPQAIAGDFWREDRTDAFYPAPYNMAGSNTTLNMQVQSKYLLNMAYCRIKNITIGYTLPAQILQKAKITKLRVYAALENFFTFDKLRGLPIDPEVIQGYSMWNDENYNSGRTGVGVPTYKSVSLGLQLNF
jgi:TonB-linked SusC/RagA family outer membrane protein